MPKNEQLRKILVIGSGPIVIGQAAEFDYAGTQACQVLKEQGLEVVLINSNPATIMTDPGVADRTYLEPVTPEIVTRIIERERPDGILATLGGQVGLNMALTLGEGGVLERYGVRLLGTPLDAIQRSEDRQLFKDTMEAINQPVLESYTVTGLEQALPLAAKIGYPLVVRPAFTLGGTGGGMVTNEEELTHLLPVGLEASPIHQVLLERSLKGWKEIEFEVLRDAMDNCITICSMENIDPLGIHTGDSVVVAPTQTLSDKDYQMMRSAALSIIRGLGIEGGCNVQFALDPLSQQYYVIEVNPRVSRSSALASKATGYPIARISTLIALGYHLDEIPNPVTQQTSACFEPAIDYVVVKMPRWPFDKFRVADRGLGTQMKSTGEVMAIGRTMAEALQKAARSLEQGFNGLWHDDFRRMTETELMHCILKEDDRRLFAVVEALRRGTTVHELHAATKIDHFFLHELERITLMEKKVYEEPLTAELLIQAKRMGFANGEIARLTGRTEGEIRTLGTSIGLKRVYKTVDTCAGEFDASTPYFYGTMEQEDEATPITETKAVVIGSGPIRIGQGIEFDYCSVQALEALKEEGIRSIMINNNPETVSTDFNRSDRLYFEPLAQEEVLEIMAKEQPLGALVQFGGQTAINLAGALHENGFPILGSSVDSIDLAEDRQRFDQLLETLQLKRPAGRSVWSLDEAYSAVTELGFPVLVRPSYVLGGRGMEICYSRDELAGYLTEAVRISPDHPVLIDRYISGQELEVDAIADGERVLVAGIMEHIERAGVHSGDSIAVYPWFHLEPWLVEELVEATHKLALGLKVKGLVNIQFVRSGHELYVIEVNPRSSRTVPFLSKVAGLPMVKVATKVALGQSLEQQGYPDGLWPAKGFYAVKAPVFSWSKLRGVEIGLGPEMKSTGEVIGMGQNREEAMAKAFWAAGWQPGKRTLLATVADRDKAEAVPLIKQFWRAGFTIYATEKTGAALQAAGVNVTLVGKIGGTKPTVIDVIKNHEVEMVINTVTKGKLPERDGFAIRRAAVEHSCRYFTSLDTFLAYWRCLRYLEHTSSLEPRTLQEYLGEGNE